MSEKPSRPPEEEYFARQERERREKEALRREREAREERRALHFMKCPKCGADLAAEHFKEVEVDRCSECYGVWLDAGELERLAGSETTLLRDTLDVLLRRKR